MDRISASHLPFFMIKRYCLICTRSFWLACLVLCPLGMHGAETDKSKKLPFTTVFQGETKFQQMVKKAQAERWRDRPLGQRTVLAARALLGTRYVNFTLEVDDHIESPVVNLHAMDCWTFYENALGFARMLREKPGPYRPDDLLRMVELERYRQGKCDGSYLSRMHHLEEVFADNQRRGLAEHVTRELPGAVRLRKEVTEMTEQWQSYRYLKANPSLLKPMAQIEKRISSLPVHHVPKHRVREVEALLQDGDICAITTTHPFQYTCHVGLIMRLRGRAYFMHATSSRDKGRCTVLDKPITDYLQENPSHAGIVICRPKDLPIKAPKK
ncbi:MAG: hypothetical protein RLZZ224_565 [Verrucomicrobiota bacterium]